MPEEHLPERSGADTLSRSARVEARDTPEFMTYQHLLALVSTLPASATPDPAKAAALNTFHTAAAAADELFRARPDNYVERVMRHLLEMELALIRVLPNPDLTFRLAMYRSEFRRTSSEKEWHAYAVLQQQLAADAGTNQEALMRAEAVHLLLEMDRAPLIDRRAEEARSFLVKRLYAYCIRLLLLTLLPIGLFFFEQLYLRYHGVTIRQELVDGGNSALSRDIARLAIFAFVAAFGVVGAFVSAAQRVQRMPISGRIARDTFALASMAEQLRWSPVTGAIFAVVLCLTFWGGFLQGSLFPNVGGEIGHELTNVLYYNMQFGKLLVWSFLAGFSERLVPDLLDRLLTQGKRESGDRVPAELEEKKPGA